MPAGNKPPRGLGLAALTLAILILARPARAQDFGYIDANGLPAAGPAQPFFAVPSARTLGPAEFAVAWRSSLLVQPISGAQPSPDPDGTDTAVVADLWLQEFLLGVGLGAGIDVSLALPVHLQSGQGLTGVGIGEELAPVALGDLRIGVGAGWRVGAWTIGPRVTVYLPVGQEEEFAGERLPRGDLGMTASLPMGPWTLAGALFARLRETSQLGNTRWSTQAVLSLGARYAWTPSWDTGLEFVAAPTLSDQPAPPSGSSGYLLPAEMLLGAHYRASPVLLGAFVGTGLPLSVASHSGTLTRGPTSPLLRIGIEIGATF